MLNMCWGLEGEIAQQPALPYTKQISKTRFSNLAKVNL